MDRTEACRLIAKVFAFLAVGNRDGARIAAVKLISWLETL